MSCANTDRPMHTNLLLGNGASVVFLKNLSLFVRSGVYLQCRHASSTHRSLQSEELSAR